MTRDTFSGGRRRFLQGLAGLFGILAADRALGAAKLRIRLAINGRFSPLSFTEKTGEAHGLLVDELRLMAESAGLALDFVDRPWARGQQMVRSGALDGFCTIPTAERRNYVLFAPTPLLVEDNVVVARAGDPRLEQARSLDDIKGLKFAEPLGTGSARSFLREDQIVWSADIANILAMIDAGRVDGAFFGRYGAEAALATYPRADRLRMTVFPSLPQEEGYCLGLRKSFPDASGLISRIDAVLRDLVASDAFAPIRARYLTPAASPPPGNP
jgi:polar amino acid transport system substrate-binding protein